MNIKRFFLSLFAVFGFLFLFDFIVHGLLLTSTYAETPNVWREKADMQAKMPLAIILELALAIWLTYVFSRIYPEGGTSEGLYFGLYFGVFAAILSSAWYVWLPVTAKLGWSWFISGLIEGIGSGLILGAINKRENAKSSQTDYSARQMK